MSSLSSDSPGAPQAPGALTSFLASAKSVLALPSWWRQQAWVAATEMLMGFLAAWGLIQGLPAVWIPLGLALAYGANSLGMWCLRTYGRRAGWTAMAMASASLAITLALPVLGQWVGLCFTVGVLLAFRDHQSVHSLAWMPVRARRAGGNSAMALTAGAILGAALLATFLTLAGVATLHWAWVPQAVGLAALVFLVPAQVMRMGRGQSRKAAANALPAHDEELTWLLKLSVAFNAVNFLGRRIVLPWGIVAIAQSYGSAANALPLLGGALGLMGLVGMLARLPLAFSKRVSGRDLMRWGARASLMGWLILAGSLIVWGVFHARDAIGPMLVGWALLEITNKTWAVAYMEALRASAVGTRLSASRSHRRALNRFMVRKSAGGAVGCAAGALVAPMWAPAVVVLLVVGCWTLIERGPYRT